jgi:glucokinase
VSGLTIGLDVGGTKCLGVVLTADDSPVAEIRVATPAGGDALIDTLVTVVGELRDVAGPVDGVGLGIAGQLDLGGVLRYAPNLVQADEFPIRDLLAARVDVPLRIDNDANCAAVAELHHGAMVGISHAVLVNLGTGIGSAVIVDGRLYRGANGMAGEWGHTTVSPGGLPCACGRQGCWEAYGSAAGLVRLTREVVDARDGRAILALAGGDPDNVRGEHVTRAARSGDHEALAVLDHFARWVALGIANITAALDPEAVVVGGGLVTEADLFMEGVRAHHARVVLGGRHRPDVAIVPAALGERAGALGAAILARPSPSG